MVHTLANLTDVAKEQEERGGKRIGAIFPNDNSNVNFAHIWMAIISIGPQTTMVWTQALGPKGKVSTFFFSERIHHIERRGQKIRRETMMPEGKISVRLLASYDYEKNSFTSSLSRASHGKTWLATRRRQ